MRDNQQHRSRMTQNIQLRQHLRKIREPCVLKNVSTTPFKISCATCTQFLLWHVFFAFPISQFPLKKITASFCNANRVQLLQILFLPMDDKQHWLQIKHELTWILRISLGGSLHTILLLTCGLFGSFVKCMMIRMELEGHRPYIYKYAI